MDGSSLASLLADAAGPETLRRLAQQLADGSDWSRVDDHALVDALAAAAAAGTLALAPKPPPQMRRIAPKEPPPAAPPPPAAAAAPRSSPAAAPAPAVAEPELDVPAMVATLEQASRDGVPFCEECARAAAEAAA